LKEEIKKGEVAGIKQKMETLQKEFYAISSRLYQQQQAQQQSPPPGGQQSSTGANPDGTVDAEYKIIDDEDEKKK
jgi:molecular chaperone DnaK